MKVPAALVLFALAVGVPACGGGETERRPTVVSTFPAPGQVLPGGLKVIKITYDSPVFILNPNDAHVNSSVGSILIGATKLPNEPESVYVIPQPGINFPSGVSYSLFLAQGLVINSDLHYPRDPVEVIFTSHADSEVILGSKVTHRVVLASPADFTEIASTPTPAGRDPVGLLGSEQGGVRKVWVQLTDGAGAGKALAWFVPGDAAMTEVPLSHLVDLTGSRPAIAMSVLGDTIYAAFRDEGLGQVRLCAVNVATGTETGSILLSPAASATTFPTGLTADRDGLLLYASCNSAAGARLCLVSTQSFAEIDTGGDPGIDGVAVAAGEGPMVTTIGRAAIAPLGTPDSRLVTVDLPIGAAAPALPAVEQPSGPLGNNTSVMATNDGLFYVQGLSGSAPNLLVERPSAAPYLLLPVEVSDDVAGAPTGATAVRALGAYPSGGNFCVILDSDVAALFTWTTFTVVQRDLDTATTGIQCVPLPPTAAGADVVGFFQGATP